MRETMTKKTGRPKALSFFGPQQVGKSTIAKHLAKKFPERFRYRNFAGPIYAMATAFYGGELPTEKEAPNPLSGGKSLRQFLQILGTEFGRDMIDQNVWANLLIDGVRRDNEAGLVTVTDDCRFWNEYNLLTEAGAAHISVSREGHGPRGTHKSELEWQEFSSHAMIYNSGKGMNDYIAYAEGIVECVMRTNLEDLTPNH